MQDDPLLAEVDAAKHLHRHPQTIRKQRREGRLPFPYLRVGGRYLYRLSHLDEYLAECVVNPEGDKQ